MSSNLRDRVRLVLEAVVAGYDYNPGDSDLDNEQPIHVRMTMGEYRKSVRCLNEVAAALPELSEPPAPMSTQKEVAQAMAQILQASSPEARALAEAELETLCRAASSTPELNSSTRNFALQWHAKEQHGSHINFEECLDEACIFAKNLLKHQASSNTALVITCPRCGHLTAHHHKINGCTVYSKDFGAECGCMGPASNTATPAHHIWCKSLLKMDLPCNCAPQPPSEGDAQGMPMAADQRIKLLKLNILSWAPTSILLAQLDATLAAVRAATEARLTKLAEKWNEEECMHAESDKALCEACAEKHGCATDLLAALRAAPIERPAEGGE
jgi:hypothetical protein